ncbi:hypothetical protein [Arenibaculum pallidiluteum]|uniref:hypothetical protein n=1 Tax=Arenibaculum pallidiluteum TaxID=2812559 RepID=UPI001A95C910|nr:hypothetical protein [Arenibaculum pallidiluteum]
MSNPRDQMPPAGPTDAYPDIRGAGPEETTQDAIVRIAAALEGLLLEVRGIRAHLGVPEPKPPKAPTPEWPPKVET